MLLRLLWLGILDEVNLLTHKARHRLRHAPPGLEAGLCGILVLTVRPLPAKVLGLLVAGLKGLGVCVANPKP